MRYALLALLLAAPLAAQEPADSILEAEATLTLALPPGSIVLNDTTVNHEITFNLNLRGLAPEARDALGDSAQLALNSAIRERHDHGGVPGWFYGGALAGFYAWIIVSALKEESTTVVTVTQDQSQEQDQTTTTTTTTTGMCWPPGFCKRKKNHGGGEPEED